MSIQQILGRKGNRLVTIRPEDTVETAAMLLTTNNIGAVPVRDAGGAMVGVISERDLVRGYANSGTAVMSFTVQDLMTKEVTSVGPGESIKNAMEKMSKRHIRHLPVVDDDGALIGVISQRDVMDARLQQTEMETEELRAYAIASGGNL
mgnify:CR=1 FL=1